VASSQVGDNAERNTAGITALGEEQEKIWQPPTPPLAKCYIDNNGLTLKIMDTTLSFGMVV
jgi:hypothetical protein